MAQNGGLGPLAWGRSPTEKWVGGKSRYPVDRDWNDCYPAPGPGTIPYDPVKTKRDFFCFNTPAPHTEHGYVIGQEMGGFFMAFSV